MSDRPAVFVHLGAGIGNIVLATPLIVALERLEFQIDLFLSADYPGTADLFRDWSVVRRICTTADPARLADSYEHVIPAVPPFYWPMFWRMYRGLRNVLSRPPDSLFDQNEQGYYLSFASRLGYRPASTPFYRLPITPLLQSETTLRTLVIAPGCKTGEMAAKRWPWFPELSEAFDDVAVVGTPDDLYAHNGLPLRFPRHVRLLAGSLSLRETAEVLASAGAVVGNDSGLTHIAGAVGTPTLMIFGPTPHQTLGPMPGNLKPIRSGLPCEPCWSASRFEACSSRIDCLSHITPAQVEREIRTLSGL